jgi:hypothetical protein
MKARPGDKLVVRSAHVGGPWRSGLILEVRRLDGGPPYYVRWDDDGHESLIYPGRDAYVEHLSRAS